MAYTYLSPFSGFNAWSNYNTPEENKGFNYTMDPYYNVAGDQQRWDLAQTGANSETNRARVWRWTLDNLRAQGLDPGKAPQATVNQYYLNNIGRLRQDYQANGFDWNRSGFSGYDKFLQTDPANMPGGPRPTDPNGNPIDPSNVGKKGPNTSPPVKNPGLPTPNPGVNGGYNAALADQLNSNPDYAFRYMLRQLGFDPNAPSRFGDYMKKRFQPLLSADLAARGLSDTGGPGGAQAMQTIANDVAGFGRRLFAGGGDFFGQERDLANNAMGNQNALDFLGNVGEQSAVEQYLNQLATLKYAGSNPMIQQSIADTIQRGQQQYEDFTTEQLTSGQSLGDPYLEWLRRNPAYNRYLGVH
jgi:hypothetical protein